MNRAQGFAVILLMMIYGAVIHYNLLDIKSELRKLNRKQEPRREP